MKKGIGMWKGRRVRLWYIRFKGVMQDMIDGITMKDDEGVDDR